MVGANSWAASYIRSFHGRDITRLCIRSSDVLRQLRYVLLGPPAAGGFSACCVGYFLLRLRRLRLSPRPSADSVLLLRLPPRQRHCLTSSFSVCTGLAGSALLRRPSLGYYYVCLGLRFGYYATSFSPCLWQADTRLPSPAGVGWAATTSFATHESFSALPSRRLRPSPTTASVGFVSFSLRRHRRLRFVCFSACVGGYATLRYATCPSNPAASAPTQRVLLHLCQRQRSGLHVALLNALGYSSGHSSNPWGHLTSKVGHSTPPRALGYS